MKDLWGNPITPEETKGKRDKSARGNPAPIGSGPDGEFCRTCRHAYYHETAKRYWKCALVKPTRGLKTDIRLKWPACSRWEPKEEGQEAHP